MEPILELPAQLPPHRPAPFAPVATRIVAEWPNGTFLENLVVLPDGSTIVSVLSEGRLDRVTAEGARTVLRQFDAPPTGLALIDGSLFVAVGEPGGHAPDLWRLDPATGAGDPWMTLADVTFANGVTPFAPGCLLVAESWQGRLVLVDLAARTTRTWLADPLLERAPGVDFLPGANGVKRFGTEVTVSSNGRALLLRAEVTAAGTAGPLKVLADQLRVDDFAYDSEGVLYLTTHIGHSLDRLSRDGTRVTLAGAAEGLAGSTACAFDTSGGLLVTTTGGIVAPVGGVLEPARLVWLDTDVAGLSLDHPWEKPA